MGIVGDMAYQAGRMAGESRRKKESAERVAHQDQQTREWRESIERSAADGDVQAMFDLGYQHSEGQYMVLDYDRAQYWWEQAAMRGHVDAQYDLGVLYYGELSPYYHDDNLAGTWFSRAANNGHRDAAVILQEFQYSRLFKKWSKRG